MNAYAHKYFAHTKSSMSVRDDLLDDLEASADRLESKIERYRESPQEVAEELLDRVEKDLDRTTHHDTPEGDRCMHEHLQYLKRAYETEPTLIVQYQMQALNEKLQDMRAAIQRVES